MIYQLPFFTRRNLIRELAREARLYVKLLKAARQKIDCPFALGSKWHVHYTGFDPNLQSFRFAVDVDTPFWNPEWSEKIESELALILQKECHIEFGYRQRHFLWFATGLVSCIFVDVIRLDKEQWEKYHEGIHAIPLWGEYSG